MPATFSTVPKAKAGDRVAVLSPAFAAPAVSTPLHEQAMRRLTEATGLIPVGYPTTRQLGASAEARAADVTAAFADPDIRAVLATVGGDDQITVIPHVDADVVAANPKPFLGYSDNTNLHNLLWTLGVPSFYGGSTQVHLGPGPHVDEIHLRSLRAALLTGGVIELTEPGESEDFGRPWEDDSSLTEFGERGLLAAVAGVLVARAPVSAWGSPVPPIAERARLRAAQRDTIVEQLARYNPDAVVCVGVPFGHTRPQWVIPHGGRVTLDGARQRLTADYS